MGTDRHTHRSRVNFCTPSSLKIRLKKKEGNGEVALVLKASFICINLGMGEWAQKGWIRHGGENW